MDICLYITESLFYKPQINNLKSTTLQYKNKHLILKERVEEEPRWRRNRTGRPLSLLQIHGRTIECWTKFTKRLLITSSGHQAPREAAHCLRREVGQNIKDKKGDKRARDGDPSWEGSLNRGSFQSPGNPGAGESGGSFQISEGNLTGRRN